MRMQITLSELFQFCMVIIGIIGLVMQAKKEVTAVHLPQSRRLLCQY
jgi:hypothetical protein